MDYWGRPAYPYEPKPYYVYDYYGVPHLVDPNKDKPDNKDNKDTSAGTNNTSNNSSGNISGTGRQM